MFATAVANLDWFIDGRGSGGRSFLSHIQCSMILNMRRFILDLLL